MTLETVHPELVEGLPLVCHPETPCSANFAISARIWRERNSMELSDFWVSFLITGAFDAIAQPRPAKPYRTDNLWSTTCFELFLKREDGSYIEVNFSPSSQWAAYEFDGYRSGQIDLAVDFPPGTTFSVEQDHVLISTYFNARDLSKFDVGISAVIEEKDGTKSYWALRHPPGKPDFHHPDCFAQLLPAPA